MQVHHIWQLGQPASKRGAPFFCARQGLQPLTSPLPQDYWTAHYFWRTWMPELHQQPFVLVVDTVTHGAAHAYVAKQITLCAFPPSRIAATLPRTERGF